MATAVLDLEFTQLPHEISGLDRYRDALVLMRQRGRPFGQVLLPVVNGRLGGGEDFRTAFMRVADSGFWEQWLRAYLESSDECRGNASLPKATVAVCTRDRPEDLRRCLNALMQLPDDGQEFLVIDNCPTTEATRRLVEDYNRVRYVREVRAGLNVARNRALREATHDIVAFTDDDAVPDPEWLRALLQNFQDPLVLCATGLTLPLELETEAQQLFEAYSTFNRGFRRTVFDSRNLSPLAAGRAGAGVNMALRRSGVEHVGAFNEVFDAGTPTCSGGDTDMFARIIAAGYKIVYEPSALCWHRHRRTYEEVRQTLFGYGVGTYAVWTHRLFVDGELTTLAAAWSWFRHSQLPALVRSLLRRPQRIPPDLVLAELHGCVLGPWAYVLACRQHKA